MTTRKVPDEAFMTDADLAQVVSKFPLLQNNPELWRTLADAGVRNAYDIGHSDGVRLMVSNRRIGRLGNTV